MKYQAALVNPKPPGTIDSFGTFGPWNREEPSETPIAGKYTFENADLGVFRGFALADLNGDGYLDYVLRDIFGVASIRVSRCGDAGWLMVRLEDAGPNRFGVGARVEVTAGGVTQLRWIHAGSTNLASSAPPEAHFGLGAADGVETLRVVWPDGGESVFADVPGRRVVRVTREQ